jgi:adenine deaminase
MTARSAEAFTENLDQMHREMNQLEWLEEGRHSSQDVLGTGYLTELLIYSFLTCPPWHWTMILPMDQVPAGLLNIRTGQTHPVV